MSSIGDFIHQHKGNYPETFKFSEPGDTLSGTVTRREAKTLTNLRGESEDNLILEIEDEGGDGHTVFAKSGGDLLRKLAAALAEAKPNERKPGVEEGDWLSIRFDHTEPARTKGHNPRKVFVVAYKVAEPASVTAADVGVD